jgi:VCBS repeat-containing protein
MAINRHRGISIEKQMKRQQGKQDKNMESKEVEAVERASDSLVIDRIDGISTQHRITLQMAGQSRGTGKGREAPGHGRKGK